MRRRRRGIVRLLLLVIALDAVACVGGEPPFEANMTYEHVATVGKVDESDSLFIYASREFRLVDSTRVAYSDNRIPGRLVVADILTGKGWSLNDSPSADGPGELGGKKPWISTASDTIKLLTPDGRLSARLMDGTLVYDSFLAYQDPGRIGFAGLARNNRITVYNEPRVGGEIGFVFESPSGYRRYPFDTIEHEDQILNTGIVSAARDDLIAYTQGRKVHTFNGVGLPIASRELPWKTFSLSIDGSGRVWVQVFGDARGGYNLVILDRNLELVGRAVVPGFRDAYGDYMISVSKDDLGVQELSLLRLVR